MTVGNCLVVASALCLSLELPMAAMLREGPHDEDGHAEAFHRYMEKHRRSYQRSSSEYKERLALFSHRMSKVEAQNSHPGRLWTAAINKFSDRTKDELEQLRGWRGHAAHSPGTSGGSLRGSAAAFRQQSPGRILPTEFMEWGKLAAAQSDDQGSCGSCWAVATAKMLDLHMQIYNPNEQRAFSAQELVSCVPNPKKCGGSGGCQGATVELALHWTTYKGLAKSSETPYEARDTSCKKTPDAGGLMQLPAIDVEEITSVGVHEAPHGSPSISFGMIGWERLPVNKYLPVLQALYERGPVGISVSASRWFHYKEGIYDGCDDDWVVDHAVVLIGYGKTKDGVSYYSIQNSWGPDWGEDGRIRIIRHDDDGDRCGTDYQPEQGTGCDGGPAHVRVCGPCGVLYDNAVPHFRNATA